MYVKAKNRYLLRVNLIDDHEGIWASAYDNEGEMILAKESE